jgi:transcriptional regulator with XRE-family HTH domain
MPAIGNKIKKLRELKGFKQEYMAERLGITQQSYSKLESDKGDIPFSRIEQLADIFEMKPEDLVAFDEKMVFNVYGQQNCGYLHGNQINFPEQLKQLYEDKIKFLEEKVAWLEKR